MVIEGVVPSAGASLIVGASKSGKTLLGVQMALAIASGAPLFEQYRILKPGPVLVLEQDDPAGAASIKDILQRSPIPVDELPFYLVPRVPWVFGPELLDWLGGEIAKLDLSFVLLDSYTALRGQRGANIDIVKREQSDLMMIDELAKKTHAAILIVHHASKGSFGMDWSDRAAGSFAMSAATESQVHVSRFSDLDSNAPERLVRVRGRHTEGVEMVLRFEKETLRYTHVLEGGAAPLYPLLLQIQSEFPARVRERVILELESGLSALGGTVFALRVLCEDGVHVVFDAVTALVADAADPIQSSDQCVASFGWQCVRGSHRLFKHSHQCIEVAFILIAEVARKTGGLLAIEDHQLG